jgi:hypothetical protein
VEGALNRFTELRCIYQRGNKDFVFWQRGHVELVTKSEEYIDTRCLSLSFRQPEMCSNPESLAAKRNVQAHLIAELRMHSVGAHDQRGATWLSVDKQPYDASIFT